MDTSTTIAIIGLLVVVVILAWPAQIWRTRALRTEKQLQQCLRQLSQKSERH